jgi:hypothetical protein
MLSAPFSNLSDMNTHSACLRHRDNDGKFSGQWAACTAYEAAWATKAAATTAAAVSALSSVTDAEDSAALLRLQSPP